jgi:hypothetical protein
MYRTDASSDAMSASLHLARVHGAAALAMIGKAVCCTVGSHSCRCLLLGAAGCCIALKKGPEAHVCIDVSTLGSPGWGWFSTVLLCTIDSVCCSVAAFTRRRAHVAKQRSRQASGLMWLIEVVD